MFVVLIEIQELLDEILDEEINGIEDDDDLKKEKFVKLICYFEIFHGYPLAIIALVFFVGLDFLR